MGRASEFSIVLRRPHRGQWGIPEHELSVRRILNWVRMSRLSIILTWLNHWPGEPWGAMALARMATGILC